VTDRRTFALSRRSVAASRNFIGHALADLPDELREAAVLMMSELATNAIVHAGTGFEVTIDRSPGALRVAVADLGGGEPAVQDPSSSEPHGRGLQIVTRLADDWGMTDNHDRSGKTVWYVIRMDQPEPVEARVDSVRGRMARQAAAQSRRGDHRQPDGDGEHAESPGGRPSSRSGRTGRGGGERFDGSTHGRTPCSRSQATVPRPSRSVSMSSACSSSTARISSSMRRVVGSPEPSHEMTSL